MNDAYSLLVTAEFDSDELINFDYEVVEQAAEDKFGVLNLVTGDDGPSYGLVLNGNYKDSNDEIISLMLPGDNQDIGYSCKCQIEQPVYVGANDCKVRKYYRYYVYCDGTICTTCSLVLQFSPPDGSDFEELENTSLILLPTLNLI